MDASFFRCKQVLVIESSAAMRASVKAMLQTMGFEAIHLSRDANDALSRCHNIPFDFILCDFNLGDGKDGYQLFETLKQQVLMPPLCCFVMISAESQRQLVHGVIELQPDDYILKPFTYPILNERLIRAVKQKIALRKVYLNLFANNDADAIRECDSVVINKPEFSAQAQRLKGELLLKTGQYQQAEHFYKSVLAHKPLPWARLGAAIAAFYLERWDDTELQLADLTQFDITKVEALDWLSHLMVKHGRYDSAQQTLYQAVLLSPKNIKRQRTLCNLNVIIGDKEAAARINAKLVAAARYSVDDSAENYLNHARSLVDVAYSKNPLERTVVLQNASQLVDIVSKRFADGSWQKAVNVLRSRILAAKGQLIEARQPLLDNGVADKAEKMTIDSCMDAAKAYFELGDIHSSQFYIDKLAGYLINDDYLTETQKIMLKMEKVRHEALKATIKQISAEAAEAYEDGFFNQAFSLFCETFDHMPTNSILALNILQTATKCSTLATPSLRYCKHAIKLLQASELEKPNLLKFQHYVKLLCEQYPELVVRTRRPKANS
ncbi:chemotaxis protein CheY [Arsukibacterium ikkense]|uniref:Chemotaxis protein CheY n=1 Tax=Arsukibacterium ikkense TaxID=336831 RepID=A0A0M2V3Z4_9GAMM|nr:response regulator [Arsukibacterium ikkense]KKO45361.1 chemotaxis protein CheY [Arsukibacterium ikkense]